MKRIVLFLFLIFTFYTASAHVHGVVLSDAGEPLVGANVYWSGTGIGTATDAEGQFSLEPVKGTKVLVTSYLGYHNDTTTVIGHKPLTIVLVEDNVLDEVSITERKMSVVRNRLSAFDTQTLGAAELCKAACCNLSESFETNASVDVAYADAATGAKTIRLLGLSGTYVQLLGENCPAVRGLAQNFGMEYIPGPWMESIQVSKGTSSVINGYEAITGQINVEYLKPQTQEPIAVNLMLNTELHAEANIMGGWDINKTPDQYGGKMHTGLLAHYQNGSFAMDDNHDGFLDMPLNQNLNLLNRWYYKNDRYTFQFLIQGIHDERHGGQRPTLHQRKKGIRMPDEPYLIDLRTDRISGFMKNGIVFDPETGMSLGIITSASYHQQDNRYGLSTPLARDWKADQWNAYANIIFQNSWCDETSGTDMDHKLSAGFSLNYDRYNEHLQGATPNGQDLSRSETTPGLFAEYNFKLEDVFSMIAGVRGDYSTRYGFFFTPRLNLRYAPFEWWTIRGSVGLGYRSPNIVSDNAAFLPSARIWTITEVKQERSLNAGATFAFDIPIASKTLQLTAEYYYTNFFDGLIADMDRSRNGVTFFNLSDVEGARSFSHNAQIEATMEILRGWTLTAAFRYTDVKQTTYCSASNEYQLRDRALQGKFKGVITTSYQTPLKKWQFDLTAQFNGGGRLPDGFDYMADRGMIVGDWTNRNYTWYPQLMAQVTKYWRTCSLYVGAENMTNFTQKNPIVGAGIEAAAQKAFIGPDFDASMVWGPTTGWKIYVGFRWALDRPDED